MKKAIALSTLAYIIKAPWRGKYAAVTRENADHLRYGVSYCYSIKQLALRSNLARGLQVPA